MIPTGIIEEHVMPSSDEYIEARRLDADRKLQKLYLRAIYTGNINPGNMMMYHTILSKWDILSLLVDLLVIILQYAVGINCDDVRDLILVCKLFRQIITDIDQLGYMYNIHISADQIRYTCIPRAIQAIHFRSDIKSNSLCWFAYRDAYIHINSYIATCKEIRQNIPFHNIRCRNVYIDIFNHEMGWNDDVMKDTLEMRCKRIYLKCRWDRDYREFVSRYSISCIQMSNGRCHMIFTKDNYDKAIQEYIKLDTRPSNKKPATLKQNTQHIFDDIEYVDL